MHDPDAQTFRSALDGVREDIVAAIDEWRAGGGRDEELALLVDGLHSATPTVLAETRKKLELTIPAFDPTIAIELAKHAPGRVPAVVDLHDLVRRVVWIDLTPPYSW
ncbi:MAG TPA: hypothetical protein VGL81_02495 [Polyangiaceae bacterium]|jgi:hypothetical protein